MCRERSFMFFILLSTSDTDSLTTSYFTVNQTTGLILLKNGISATYNTSDYFTLNINIMDTGSCCPDVPSSQHTTSGTVVVRLQGINTTTSGTVVVRLQGINTQPTFAYCYGLSASIQENSNPDTPITTSSPVRNLK